MGCPGGRHLQVLQVGGMKRDVGNQALCDLTTIAEQPGEVAAGNTNRHILPQTAAKRPRRHLFPKAGIHW